MFFIGAALITYTIAVWGEQIPGELKPVFVLMFCVGVVCDTTGTTIMALNLDAGAPVLGPLDALFHAVTGLAAIILMLIHAVWAIRVLLRKDATSAERFHRFSKYVWLFWLVPFFSPMVAQLI
ncbi:MAG: TIGR03987 family protein [Candidatus Thorarchaeota archaeon]|nr:MAG: TIGR03987 family protein [Candidatus Thorarchaeota archaeon]